MSNRFGFNEEFIFGFEGRNSAGRIREPLQGPNMLDGVVLQNGFNTYQISFEPEEDTLEIYCDGLLLKEGPSKDFIRNGTNIVFIDPPTEGVSLEAIYFKA